ncbi:hypothetical protein [Alistipes senegalensis]|uniref:hypothetical protein n=1 Tax=Alistipes senegalensis TaxID=1288121 RepID=UPI00242B018F|nr:hypothetical protein [Alistipes senegalensis]
MLIVILIILAVSVLLSGLLLFALFLLGKRRPAPDYEDDDARHYDPENTCDRKLIARRKNKGASEKK